MNNSLEEISGNGLPQLTKAEELQLRIDEVQTYVPRIAAIVRKIVINETDVMDITQDVLLKVMQQLPNFRGDAALGTWIHRIAVNASLMFRRKHKVRMRREESSLDETNLGKGKSPRSVRKKMVNPEIESDRKETRKLLEKAIKKLPKENQEVLAMADIDDLRNEEIAEKLSITLAAVKSRLHRARKMMRQHLSPHFEPDAISPPVRPEDEGAV